MVLANPQTSTNRFIPPDVRVLSFTNKSFTETVQERAQISFCPIARQVLHYLARELCRQTAAWILSRMAPILLVWGVRKGGLGGGW